MLGLALVAPLAGSVSPAHAAAPDTGSSTAAALAFDLPPLATLRSSPRKAFAHWVPSLPVSLDNAAPGSDYYQTQYLNPDGEGGKAAAYGGYLRDRPLGRDPIGDSAWRLRDMENEVRQAASVGLDGFSVTMYLLPPGGDAHQWENINLMMQAAANVDPGFKIVLQPDMSSSVGGADAGTLAASMAQLARYSSAYRLGDGRLVVSPFYAERHDAGWWGNFEAVMRNSYGTPVAFVPMFLDEQSNEDAFAPVSYGMGNWGSRDPAANDPSTSYPTSPSARIARVHALGQKWVQPISVQDERPREGLFDEAQNTQNLRNTWALALQDNADMVQLNTWNDYPEGSPMAPSAEHGWSFLDINAYYLSWWKTGVRPAVTRDTVYLTHRKQPLAARPTFPQSLLMHWRGWGSTPRDTVEALTLLSSPGTVQVRVGGNSYSCDVPAGPGVCTVPLSPGTVSASVTRSGTTVTSLTSPYQVTSTPYVQDYAYVASSSGRSGSRTAAPAPAAAPPAPAPAPPAPAPAPAAAGDQRVVVPATEDTYANAAAPHTNFSDSWSLSADSSPAAISYLRFPVPAAPAGKTLITSSLRLSTNSLAVAGSTDPAVLRLAPDDYDASTLTWDDHPSVGNAVGTLGSDTVPDRTYDVPFDLNVARQLLGHRATIAVTPTGDDSLWLWSSEHNDPAERPQLVLTFR